MSTIRPHAVLEEHIRQTTAHESVPRRPLKAFEVHPWLRNRHLMTVLAEYWPRNLSVLLQPAERLKQAGMLLRKGGVPGSDVRRCSVNPANPKRPLACNSG